MLAQKWRLRLNATMRNGWGGGQGFGEVEWLNGPGTINYTQTVGGTSSASVTDGGGGKGFLIGNAFNGTINANGGDGWYTGTPVNNATIEFDFASAVDVYSVSFCGLPTFPNTVPTTVYAEYYDTGTSAWVTQATITTVDQAALPGGANTLQNHAVDTYTPPATNPLQAAELYVEAFVSNGPVAARVAEVYVETFVANGPVQAQVDEVYFEAFVTNGAIEAEAAEVFFEAFVSRRVRRTPIIDIEEITE